MNTQYHGCIFEDERGYFEGHPKDEQTQRECRDNQI